MNIQKPVVILRQLNEYFTGGANLVVPIWDYYYPIKVILIRQVFSKYVINAGSSNNNNNVYYIAMRIFKKGYHLRRIEQSKHITFATILGPNIIHKTCFSPNILLLFYNWGKVAGSLILGNCPPNC